MSDDSPSIYWLGPEDADPGVTPERVGAKAHGLWRMAELGLPIPPAFALPTSLCAEVSARPDEAAALVAPGLRDGLARLEAATGRRLGDERAPLLVSVRSGAARSMPGMLSTVLDVGLGPHTVHGLIRLTGDPRFAWDSYRRFLESYAVTVGGAAPASFAHCLTETVRREAARDELDLDGEALRQLAGRYEAIAARETAGGIPARACDQLTAATLAVFGSWEASKAREYRRLNRLEDLAGTAVTVQAMVFGNAGPRSGSGVAFSRNPATGEPGLYLDFLFAAQGEDVVSGRRTPLDAAALRRRLPEAFEELQRQAARLEQAFADVQDIEFTIEDGALYFLQSRSAKRTPRAALRIALDLAHEGLLQPQAALHQADGIDLARAGVSHFADIQPAVARGAPASAGVASGRAAFDAEAAKRLAGGADPVILVRREPATDDIEGFAVADGLLTAVGGRTAHAAVVARQMGKACVVGCAALDLDVPGQPRLAGRPLTTGDWLSLDGETGEVTLGRRTVVTEAPTEMLAALRALAAQSSEAAARA